MNLQIYNTLSRQKETFTPVVPGHVGMYFCGPTVYSDPHLGHARGPVFFDVVRAWLEHNSLKVRLVSNITDVGHLTDDGDEGEDKLAKRAALEKLEPMEIADKYFWAFVDSTDTLGVRRPDIMPRATGHIIEMIELSRDLIARGHAYEVNGSVYFDVNSFPEYGKLSGRNIDDQVEGTRVQVRSEKRNPRDFALWKKAEPEHIMRWPSPWGEGFPGWHIECSVMSAKYLGDTFDIHGGGIDLQFPHHECEIAQSRAAGQGFARFWMHWNFITLEGEKMSKSKGHFKTLTELFDAYDPMVIRLNLIKSHYRSPTDFSDEDLRGEEQRLKRLRNSYAEIQRRLPEPVEVTHDPFVGARERFATAMNDDFNTPQAFAVLSEVLAEINKKLEGTPDAVYLSAAKAFFDELVIGVLGVMERNSRVEEKASTETLDGLVKLIAQQRQAARQRRDFAEADTIRDTLAALGIVLEDTADGTRWKLA